jgi:hypothetical protein
MSGQLEIPMTTNANSASLAAAIRDSRSALCASIMSVLQEKRGVTRLAPGEKRGGLKVQMGNDVVRATFVGGSSYMNLTRKDDGVLDSITDAMLDTFTAEGLMAWSGRGAKAVQVPVTRQDFVDALAEMKVSVAKTLAGTNTSTTDHVYESLVVDGKTIRGYRVYVGPQNGAAPKSTPGTIYVQGLFLGQTVITPAQYAKPASKSSGKSVAKRRIKRLLPSRRYVQYALEPGQDFILNLGAEAVSASDAAGITVDPDAVAEILADLAA